MRLSTTAHKEGVAVPQIFLIVSTAVPEPKVPFYPTRLQYKIPNVRGLFSGPMGTTREASRAEATVLLEKLVPNGTCIAG